MGGNVTAIMKNGVETRAEKVSLKTIGRQNFITTVTKLLKKINAGVYKEHRTKLWADEKIIDNAFIFNGSTSFVMDNNYSDDEILQYKNSVGDIDIAVPEDTKEVLWEYLDRHEGEEIIPGCMYMGSNKPTIQSIGAQINCVFKMQFSEYTVNVQIDWEFLPFENGTVSQWGKFSHSSSFDDAKAGVKAVAHKYLLRSMVGAMSIRNDIVVATGKSTFDNYKLSSSKLHINPRMMKFSVDRGLRIAYTPLTNDSGDIVMDNGKYVYKELPTSQSTFITDVKSIFKLVFSKGRATASDVNDMQSFVGILKLLKKHGTKQQLSEIHDRFIELLWASKPVRAQELEVQNADLDLSIKKAAYDMFIKTLGLQDKSKNFINAYYENYGQRGMKECFGMSFRELLESETEIKGWEY